MNERAPSASKPTSERPLVNPKTREARAAEREHDQMLVQRIVDGDRGAFREIFDRYHRRAFAVALGVVRSEHDASDIVQDAFIKVHKHIEHFEGSSSFYTWLYRIVMNLSIDHVRRTKRQPRVEYDDALHPEGDASGAEPGARLDVNPRKTVLRRELTVAIAKAVDRLPEHHRAVILLRELEGFSYEEMAEILEVPKGTVMSRLFHARKKLQDDLGPYLDGDLELEP